MNAENKICRNCENRFSIEQADLDMYGKLNVPPPTLCPACRMQRRLAYRNERRLYKRKCDLCSKDMISVYGSDAAFPVYCADCWWSDKWDSLVYGREYDLNRFFFDQFNELSNLVPHLGMPSPSNNYNSDYTSWVDECKNCYLVFGSSKCEDLSYSELCYECKNSLDLTSCHNMELSFQCVNSKQSYRSTWCVECLNCTDCSFCYDCRGSNNCFMCSNLRNKSYHFMNEPLSKEEWQKKTAEILSSRGNFKEAFKKFKEIVGRKAVHKYANITQAVNSSGNNLIQTKNATSCFDSSKLEDCRYVSYGDKIKDCMDCYAVVENSELCYEHLSTRVTTKANFIIGGWEAVVDAHVSQYLVDCQNVLGCVALRKKQYCILNKQYSPEEYENLFQAITKKMAENGEYGEFFAIADSPFAYNETIANDYFPLSKGEALKKGYKWKDDAGGTYGKETVKDSPDRLEDVKDDFLNNILACESCGKNFRILKKDIDLFRQLEVAPVLRCPDCRYKDRLRMRNPFRVWERDCMCGNSYDGKHAEYQNTVRHFHDSPPAGGPCPNEFETSYAPDRPEIIYCEECYRAEIS